MQQSFLRNKCSIAATYHGLCCPFCNGKPPMRRGKNAKKKTLRTFRSFVKYFLES